MLVEQLPWLGTQANQTRLAPEIVVASQVYKWQVVLKQILDDMDKGVLGGKEYAIDLAKGGLAIEFNELVCIAGRCQGNRRRPIPA